MGNNELNIETVCFPYENSVRMSLEFNALPIYTFKLNTDGTSEITQLDHDTNEEPLNALMGIWCNILQYKNNDFQTTNKRTPIPTLYAFKNVIKLLLISS